MRKLFETLPVTCRGRKYQAKVFRNSYGEYVARLYVNEKAYLPADYYGFDIQDTCHTAMDMMPDGIRLIGYGLAF